MGEGRPILSPTSSESSLSLSLPLLSSLSSLAPLLDPSLVLFSYDALFVRSLVLVLPWRPSASASRSP